MKKTFLNYTHEKDIFELRIWTTNLNLKYYEQDVFKL